jgi:WD40 repeat protein
MRTILSLIALVSSSAVAAAQAPSYSKQVQPFFTRYCVECHNAKEPEGGLNLESHKALLEGGGRGASVEAGKPDTSRLVRMMEGKLKPVMPPKKSKQPTPSEVALVRAWVLAGARDDGSAARASLPAIVSKAKPAPPVAALAYAPDGKALAAAGRGEVLLIDAAGEITQRVPAGGDRVTALAYSKAGTLAIAAGSAAEGYQVRLIAGGKATTAARHDDVILSLAFSPDGKLLATAGYDRLIKLWDVAANKEVRVLRDHSDSVYAVAFSPDGKLLASGGADRAIKVWDVASGDRLYTLGESTDWVYAVAWSPDRKHLAAAGVDRSLRVWQADRDGGKVVGSAFAHEAPVTRLVYSADGKTVWTLGEDRSAKSWDAAALTERKVYPRQPETPLSLAVHPAKNEIAIGRFDGALVILDGATGKTLRSPLPAKPAGPGDRFPVNAEREPNDSPRTGQMVELPVTVEGSLSRAGDLDWFRFEVKPGQEVGVRLRSSKPDLLLKLIDPDGHVVAEAASRLLGHTCGKAGVYSLGVRDHDYRGGADTTYRLSIGDVPVVTSVFPLGVRRGESAEVRLEGVNLGAKRTAVVQAPPTAMVGSRLPVLAGSDAPLGSPSLVVGEFPDVLPTAKGRAIPVPGTANGVILSAGARDDWRLEAKKGQRLIVEVNAARIGSALDSTIEILSADGKPLPRAVLRSLARTFTVFRDVDSRSPGIRIEAWSELAVNDWIHVGTDLMRIHALPRNPDDDCQFFAEQGQRLGYLGTTPSFVTQGSPLYKVSIHPPGTTFPPNGMPVTTLYWRNDDGGPGFGKDSRLVFDPPADGTYTVRVGDARGDGSKNHGYRLTVRPPKPDFTVSFRVAGSVSKGAAVPVRVDVRRLDEYDGPIDLKLTGLPQGFSAPLTNMPAGENSTAFSLYAEPTATAPAKPVTLKLQARAKIGGNEVTREATGTLPKLIEPGDLVAKTEQGEVTITPGGEARVTVTIERRNGFAGRVPVEAQGLPHGVRVLDVGLNGILITPAETRRTFVLYCEPWVKPMDHPIVVLAKREGRNTDHAAKSVLLRVAK